MLLLKTRDVAKQANVTSNTVRRWVRSGQIIPTTVIAGRSYFKQEVIDKLLGTTPEPAKEKEKLKKKLTENQLIEQALERADIDGIC
jgi:predicted site-specific integrase-resolvase|tara:strand:- start:89 stop:349 length:261 start_codon:yes stop_codon:yes gene_type:complete